MLEGRENRIQKTEIQKLFKFNSASEDHTSALQRNFSLSTQGNAFEIQELNEA